MPEWRVGGRVCLCLMLCLCLSKPTNPYKSECNSEQSACEYYHVPSPLAGFDCVFGSRFECVAECSVYEMWLFVAVWRCGCCEL